MKRSTALILVLMILSVASGYLMSKARWIAKVGMTFFHKGYNLTKIWWQGAIAVFLIFIMLFWAHNKLQQKLGGNARIIHVLILLVAIAGLYFTYDDFHTDFSHRLLGHMFHYGFYLGWVGWIFICLFFIVIKQDKTGTSTR